MKRFEIPEIEVTKFAVEDVITVSTDPVWPSGDGNVGDIVGGED